MITLNGFVIGAVVGLFFAVAMNTVILIVKVKPELDSLNARVTALQTKLVQVPAKKEDTADWRRQIFK